MYVIRNVMHCKPGMVKDLVNKLKEMNSLMKKADPKIQTRIMTDVSGARFWTAIIEVETESIERHEELAQKAMQDPAVAKSIGEYHKFVESGYREIFKLEK
jgi:hypothetical protein